MEAHSALAIAMNRLGGKSNTGEGGEDAERSNVSLRAFIRTILKAMKGLIVSRSRRSSLMATR